MPIGRKMTSLKDLKKSLAKGASGNAWIKYIPKNGSMNVRFIQEPEEWVNYVEHFDTTLRRSYPCNGEANCPGCLSQERKSNRYLANVVNVDDNDRVVPLQMPKDLANRLVVRYERNGTLTDRDFELSRAGEGLDTVYDLDAGVPDRKNITKYVPLDLLQVLDDAYNDVFGPKDEDDEDVTPPSKPTGAVRTRKRSAAAAKVDEDDEAPEDKPVAKKTAAAKKAAKKTTAKAPEPEFTPDVDDGPDDDTEPDAEPEADEEVYDEETLKALPLGALRAVARDFGVEVKGKNAPTIIAEILDMGEEVEEPPY